MIGRFQHRVCSANTIEVELCWSNYGTLNKSNRVWSANIAVDPEIAWKHFWVRCFGDFICFLLSSKFERVLYSWTCPLNYFHLTWIWFSDECLYLTETLKKIFSDIVTPQQHYFKYNSTIYGKEFKIHTAFIFKNKYLLNSSYVLKVNVD